VPSVLRDWLLTRARLRKAHVEALWQEFEACEAWQELPSRWFESVDPVFLVTIVKISPESLDKQYGTCIRLLQLSFELRTELPGTTS